MTVRSCLLIHYSFIYLQGLAFTLEERQLLGIHGLLPAVVQTEEQQIEHTVLLLDRLDNDLDKYMYLSNLADRNERLFYQVFAANVEKLLPLVYTPTVGLACQKFSLIFQNPKGLFITIKDKGHVYDVLKVSTLRKKYVCIKQYLQHITYLGRFPIKP